MPSSSDVPARVHSFADCELDEMLFQLRRRGRVVKIEPKVFDVLAYLLRHRERVVSKAELLDALWPDQAVSESVLPKCVAAARRAVGDPRSRRQVIQTVHGRGYRFVAPLRTAAGDTPSGEAPRVAAFPEPSTPFVGRAEAMQRLRDGLASACGGRGRLILVAGEPGIGKTRIAEEIAAVARQQHLMVFTGRANEAEGAPAFWPWVQVLRACLREADSAWISADMGAGAAELAELVPELRQRMPDLPKLEDVEGAQARFRLFDSFTTFLKRLALRGPIALILDDLHWADAPSLRLLRFLAGELREARLLVVSTYRDVEVRRGHPLAELLGELAREPVCERVLLRGLDRADSQILMAGLLPEPPSDQLTTAVHEMTEGNPFFVQEVVRLLASERRAAGAAAVGSWSLTLPQSVRDAIGRRLDGLSPECNRALRVASVLGREFSVAVLERVADVQPEPLLEWLAEALALRVLDEIDDGLDHYRFHHALIRQTLYDELSPPERVRLHRRAGLALEEACGAHPEPHLFELAHHFFQAAAAGEVAKAVDACVRAAVRAHQLLAYEEAARQYEHALRALALQVPRDEARHCELLLALGEAHAVSGARDRARTVFAEAAEMARHLARSDLLAAAALGDRDANEMGSPVEDTTLALLHEALAQLADTDSCLRARVLSRLAGTPPYADSMQQRAALSSEALALARQTGAPSALRDALAARLWACLGPDHIDERLAVAQEILALADWQRDKQMALLGHDAQLGAHLLRGDAAAADRALAAYVAIAEELRQPAFLFQATFCQGSRALARGEFERAEQLFRAALDRGRGTVPYAHFMFTGQMMTLHYTRGDVDDEGLSQVFFGEMMALPYSWVPAIRAALALFRLVRGETDAARGEFENLCAPGFENLSRGEHWLVTMASLGNVAALLDDQRHGAQLYDLLQPFAHLTVVHDQLRSSGGSVSTVLGSLATILGRYDDGAAHYEQAIANETAMQTAPDVLVTKSSFARLLLLRGGPGDQARAAALIDEVETGAHALGIRGRPFYLARLDELRRRTPRPRARKR